MELWFNALTLSTSDYALFTQVQAQATDAALHYMIRNFRFYMGFYFDDVSGVTILSAGTWYHVACVYDYPSRTQRIYLNGVQDATRSVAGPYKGVSGALNIGATIGSTATFNG